jgi:hypothetical protein
MKIFALGLGQINFLEYLYRSIKKLNSSTHVTIVGGQGEVSVGKVFDSSYKIRYSALYWMFAFFKSLTKRAFWRIFIYILFVEYKPAKAFHFFYHWIGEYSFVISVRNFRDADIFHFHFLQYSYLRMIYFIPRNKSVICSFWGSDLLRTNDTLNHLVVRDALQRAHCITVQSVELREIVLAKFGRKLKQKIEIVKFPLNDTVFNEIDRLGPQRLQQFRRTYGIPDDKKIVQLGNNASPFNNHVSIVQALKSSPVLNELFFVIPFNYGIEAAHKEVYKKTITDALTANGMQFSFIDAYLDAEWLACLRRTSQIMIHLPESDALSAASTEGMYAGTILITGSWLPYSPFQEAGLQYKTIQSVNDLAPALNEIVTSFDAWQSTCSVNKSGIAENFLSEKIAKKWLGLFSTSN